MSQNRAGKGMRFVVWFTFGLMSAIGCDPLATFAFLTQQEPVKKAEYPLTFDSGPKKGKEVAVAVFVE